MKPKAIIIDLDGTLCKNRNQATHGMVHWKDYWPLYEHIPQDEAQEWCVQIVNDLGFEDCHPKEIIFLTARPEHTRKMTKEWLLKELNYYEEDYELIMMPDDYPTEKSVTDYKREQVIKLKEKYDILFGIDDNKSVCEMFEEEGVKALWCGVKE